MTSSQTQDYQKGYAAGKKSADKALLAEAQELRHQMAKIQDVQRERVYLSCLDTVLRNCKNWSIGDKPIKDAEGYCTLAKVFAESSIKLM